MSSTNILGCGTALVTPFRDREVDYQAYRSLVKRQVDAGMHFLVPLGSTAETPCLVDQEKVKLFEITREVAPELPLLVGVGTNSLIHTVNNMRLLPDADLYLVVVPYYNKPTPQGQYEYFKAVAESTDKPIILYNVPGRTGVNMSAKTTLRLAEIDNIVGIKEASGNLAQIREIINGAPEDFKVFSGNDDQTLEIMQFGGAGVISVASNIAPAMMVSLVEAVMQEDYRTATSMFRRLMPLFDACFIESNPIPAKAALASMGLCANEMRLPLTPASQPTYDAMRQVLDLLGL